MWTKICLAIALLIVSLVGVVQLTIDAAYTVMGTSLAVDVCKGEKTKQEAVEYISSLTYTEVAVAAYNKVDCTEVQNKKESLAKDMK